MLTRIAAIHIKSLAQHGASLTEARYFIDATIHASLLYRTSIVPLRPEDINKLDRMCIHALQRQSRISTSSPLWFWLASAEAGGASYDSLYRKTLTAQLFQVILWLTDPENPPISTTLRARLAAHGLQYSLPTSPLFLPPAARPPPLSTSRRPKRAPLSFCEALYAHCYARGIQLTTVAPTPPPSLLPRISLEPSTPTLRESLPPEIWAEVAPHLRAFDLLYISDICDPLNGRLLSFASLQRQASERSGATAASNTSHGQDPAWYHHLSAHLRDPDSHPPRLRTASSFPITPSHSSEYSALPPTALPSPPPPPPPQSPPWYPRSSRGDAHLHRRLPPQKRE